MHASKLMIGFLALLMTGCAGTDKLKDSQVLSPADPLSSHPPFPIQAFHSAPKACPLEEATQWAAAALQVEMMVTALNCGTYFENTMAYPLYTQARSRNADLLSQAQKRISGKLGKGRAGIASFDREQTQLANILALKAGGDRKQDFCSPRRDWFANIIKADTATFQKHAEEIGKTICSSTK